MAESDWRFLWLLLNSASQLTKKTNVLFMSCCIKLKNKAYLYFMFFFVVFFNKWVVFVAALLILCLQANSDHFQLIMHAIMIMFTAAILTHIDDKHICDSIFEVEVLHPLPVYEQQVTPQRRALGNSFMPGGQLIDVTDNPVAAAIKALPPWKTDGWVGRRVGWRRGIRKIQTVWVNLQKPHRWGKTKCCAYCWLDACTCMGAHIGTNGTSTFQMLLMYLWPTQHTRRPVDLC